MQLQRTVVAVSDSGRRSYLCPVCESRGRLLTQSEVFMTGEFPAPNVQVRQCNKCGTLHELDRWLMDRSIWRGIA